MWLAVAALLLAGCARGPGPEEEAGAVDPVQPALTQAEAAQGARSTPEQTIEVTAVDYRFQPPEIRVKQGTKVTIRFANRGTRRHEFEIPANDFEIGPIQPGQTVSQSFVAEKAGRFFYECHVDDHRQRGMRGTLIVEE